MDWNSLQVGFGVGIALTILIMSVFEYFANKSWVRLTDRMFQVMEKQNQFIVDHILGDKDEVQS